MAFDPQRDYPLGALRPDLVTTPAGRPLEDLRLHDEGLVAGELRVTPETLRLQAEVAEASGRSELGANLRRAAELATLSDELILDVYTALRPRRSTAEQLGGWAVRLEDAGAPLTARFVRDAGEVYAQRGLLA